MHKPPKYSRMTTPSRVDDLSDFTPWLMTCLPLPLTDQTTLISNPDLSSLQQRFGSRIPSTCVYICSERSFVRGVFSALQWLAVYLLQSIASHGRRKEVRSSSKIIFFISVVFTHDRQWSCKYRQTEHNESPSLVCIYNTYETQTNILYRKLNYTLYS